MPMITVQLAAEPDARLANEVQQTVGRLTAENLGKDPAVTAIAVEFIPRRFWFIAGRSVEERGTSAFFVDVRVSDGTNTKDEKARYVARTFEALSRALGGVHPESYVHVDDARADAYGYGGKTQERRSIEGRPAPAVE
ncbi:MAG: 4-oxalocrotonate tautomerase family protein [Anaeromyxobacteraceae bacterium]